MLKKIAFYVLLIFFLLGAVEALSFVSVIYLEAKGAVYKPYKISATTYENYLQIRDPVLGWPSPSQFGAEGSEYDKAGSRVIPAFPDPDKDTAYISLYGDSFVWGAEVHAEYAYSNVLSKLLRGRVANYGVGGYGTDQAYLRFLNNKSDESEIVILAHMTENIIRNVNRFREFIYPQKKMTEVSFKPRFILSNSGKLDLIPMPRFTYEEFRQFLYFPEEIQHEYFIPGGSFGIMKRETPFIKTVVNTLLFNKHVKAKFLGEPRYKEFYDPDHSSNALAVTGAILKKFQEESRGRGKRALVLILPNGVDFLYFQKTGKWIHQKLLDYMVEEEIEFIDVSPLMVAELKGRDFRIFFKGVQRHYNEKGNAVVANILFRYLRERDLA